MTGARERSQHTSGGGGHGGASGRWLVSYADFITLMMVVFMVLYSMAKVDNAKFNQLKASLASSIGGAPLPVGGQPVNTTHTAPIQPGPDPDSATGHLNPVNPSTAQSSSLPVVTPAQTDQEKSTGSDGGETAPAAKPDTTKASTPPKSDVTSPSTSKSAAEKPVTDTTLTGVTAGLQATAAARAGDLTVQVQDRGVVVSILTSVLFAEGTADLKPGASTLLDQIAPQLKLTSDSVLVEGSPDAAAKSAPFDLASRRASVVSSYLAGTGISADRFSVIGYGKGAGIDGIVNVVVVRKK